jgi:hypothetical protein
MPRGNCSDSVRITFLDAVGLLERLQEIVDRILREGCRVKEIRVVGSVARGDHTGDSDLDLLVILRGKPPGDRLEWIRDERFAAESSRITANARTPPPSCAPGGCSGHRESSRREPR